VVDLPDDMTDEEFAKQVTESIEFTRGIGHMAQNWESARVLIAAPLSWDYVPTPFLDSMMALRKPHIWDWARVRNATSIATMRNWIVEYFLEHTFNAMVGGTKETLNFTHLFMVDADMTYPRDALQRLLNLNKDIVSGFACMREPLPSDDPESTPVFRHTCGTSRGDNDFTFDYHKQFPAEDVSEWGVVCTGGLLVKRRVFKAMAKPWFDNVLWTKTSDAKTRRVGEDVYFYSKAKSLGFTVWADTSLIYGHIIMAKTCPTIEAGTRTYGSAVMLP